ncbi:hypothetical protein RZE82_08465 [Mollicutes bacterium LVI A0039]|nr:hypothetical protein RZE82_08465 [Mollicutes bacterium LVI A0039]
MRKIAIVGMGRVGGAAAYSIGINQVVDQIVAIDYNNDLAQMQARDIQEAMIISGSKTEVIAGGYEQISDAQIMVITAGAPMTKVVDRLELFDSSQKIIDSIVDSAKAVGFNGVYVIASNPVDVMSAVVAKHGHIEPHKVIGTGTVLDNARLKYELSDALGVKPHLIESLSIGEHGNSIVPLYSLVKIDGKPLNDYLNENNLNLDLQEITKKVTLAGLNIFQAKGATEFGIGSSITKIVEAIISDSNERLLVTNCVDIPEVGEVFIPTEVAVGAEGYKSSELPPMTEEEYERFIASAQIIVGFNNQIK